TELDDEGHGPSTGAAGNAARKVYGGPFDQGEPGPAVNLRGSRRRRLRRPPEQSPSLRGRQEGTCGGLSAGPDGCLSPSASSSCCSSPTSSGARASTRPG